MRHKKHHASLGVTREHRAALLSNMAASLIIHGRIQTTLAKAKALRPFVEKLITKAKHAAAAKDPKDALHQRRVAHTKLRDEDALTFLFNEKQQEFANRPGGYTRIYKLGYQRIGDAAELAIIELIPASDEGYKKRRKSASKQKKGQGAAEQQPAAEQPAAEQPAAEQPAGQPADKQAAANTAAS
jgi:large subunit ribosomal protein L17